jgi:serine/threonine protein kinase
MLQLGQRLGDFEIVRPLGKGGMGEVYEAKQLNPPRPVALKVLAPWLAAREEALDRFWREAVVPARLDHPHIVRIISTGKTKDGIAFYTMQLVRGITLAELIRRAADSPLPSTEAAATPSVLPALETPNGSGKAPTPLPPASGELPYEVLQEYLRDRFGFVTRYGAVAAKTLAYAHSHGVLHRDIKPSNLMIDHHRQLCVLDFGLTRALGPDAEGTQPGFIRGTPWYMSPEQARGEAVDQRADIYSLGVVLYELSTRGVGPFTASRTDSQGVLDQVRGGQFIPLRTLTPEMPHDLERIILKAMQVKPERRYGTAEEMADDLSRLAEGRPLPPPGLPSHGPAALAGTLIVLLLALLGVTYLASMASFDRDPSTVPESTLPVSRATSTSADEPATRSEAPGRDSGSQLGRHSGNRSQPYPEFLLHRQGRHRIPWLRDDFNPIWCERVYGNGHYHPMQSFLSLSSTNGDLTLLALDDDPKRRWFEFSVELSRMQDAKPGEHHLGLFFGWNRSPAEDSATTRPFFVVEIDESPLARGSRPLGSVVTARLVPTSGPRGNLAQWTTPLPKGLGSVELASTTTRHRITVRALDDKVTVTFDAEAAVEVDITWLRRQGPSWQELDARGALGIWALNGVGIYRDASVVVLPSVIAGD